MQLAPLAPAIAHTDPPGAPTSRQEAAKALLAVPVGAIMTASMTAMTKQMANQPASRADLVAPLLAKLTPEQANIAMLNAIDGALALAPELAPRNEALRTAAAGVAALLAEAAADTTAAPAMQSLDRFTTPLQQVAAPLFEVALLLDPSLHRPDQG